MKTPLIIERPDLQSRTQRAASAFMTALFWLLWVSLWLPLVTLAAWAFFGQRFHLHMVELDGYQGFLGILGVYALVILLMGGGLVTWAKYNHLRFRGVDRRKATPAPTAAVLAAHFGHDKDAIRAWRGARVATVHHDSQGAITCVQAHATAAPYALAGRSAHPARTPELAPG